MNNYLNYFNAFDNIKFLFLHIVWVNYAHINVIYFK